MASSGKILVVDDEIGIREGCERALRPEGFEVSKAATLRESLALAREGDFDLVLVDVMLPDGSGMDLLRTIHTEDEEIVCIIITGYATVELAVEAIRQGAYDFISKPFSADQLIMTVNQGIEKRRLSLEARRLQAIEQQAAELSRAKEEMERLDQQKSTFMTTVAHELRSPIGGAQSLVRTLRRGLAGELNERQQQMLERVEIRLDTLLELVNDLLDLAASKTFVAEQPLQVVHLLPHLQNCVKHFEVEASGKGVHLSLESDRNRLQVMGTPGGFDQIFSNLIGNAIKYTPEGGQVRVGAARSGGEIRVTVRDTGIGIPESDLQELFQEFFRARNAKQAGIVGTGLGLSIVKQLVDRFGGRIQVESEEGKGTAFTLILAEADSRADLNSGGSSGK